MTAVGSGSLRSLVDIVIRSAVGTALLGPPIAGMACANEGPPPGAFPEQSPPTVVLIQPSPDTIVPGWSDEVKIEFDEPVRISGDFSRSIAASPGEVYDVKSGFSDLRIRPRNGWVDGVIYCFEIPSGISDLVGNRTESELGFCFSTGPEITQTEASGDIVDRVSGLPVRGARVLFLAVDGDSTLYTAASDEEGKFGLRALPPGAYWAHAFTDQNRNFLLDRALEAADSADFTLAGPSARTRLSFALVEPDSTPPVVASAEAIDSLTVELGFDDPLPREQQDLEIAIRDSAERRLATFDVVVGAAAEVEAARPRPTPDDTAGGAADSVATDSADVVRARDPTNPPLAPPDPSIGADPTGTPSGDALPSNLVTVRLIEPLRPGDYRVEVSGAVNLRNLTGDSDTTFAYTAPEPPIEEPGAAAPDSAPAPPDSAGAPPDSAELGRGWRSRRSVPSAAQDRRRPRAR